jgi:hypothetical protein
MRKIISGLVISSLAIVGGAITGTSAHAAPATPTLVVTGGNATFGLDPAIITATASAAGKVKFSAAGVAIAGCDAISTTTVAPFVAKCSWVPAAGGATVLAASFSPTDAEAFVSVDSAPLKVKVGVPVQGVVSPIHMYVDTVLASGTSGVLAPRFGVSCAITSEFIVGQGIVFRVYGNNSDLGGAVLDSKNVEKAYIEVAGVATPITMSYGNHSGASFWTGVLRTGTAAGQYNTLGLISYKVTMIAKPQTSIQVLSTKLAIKTVDGVKQKVDGKYVMERISYYKTVKLATPIAGPIGTWQSNFMPASQLTLFAPPKA